MKHFLLIFLFLFGFSVQSYSMNSDRGVGIGREDKDRGGYEISLVGVYDSTLKSIWSQIQEENYQPALESLENYTLENPDNSDGWNLFGFASQKVKNFDDAERYYQIALQIEPNHERIILYQGKFYLETDRLALATDNLKRLNNLCVFNCVEKEELSKLIYEYMN